MLFVWTKIGPEAGETLEAIVARKERERQDCNGVFWWGIGNSLGQNVVAAARANGGALPVIFTRMRTPPKKIDVAPAQTWRWLAWEDERGDRHEIPPCTLITSRAPTGNRRHYALVCRSETPLNIGDGSRRFDHTRCRTLAGKAPGASRVTALVDGSVDGQSSGLYEICFSATLVEPWFVRLARPTPMHQRLVFCI